MEIGDLTERITFSRLGEADGEGGNRLGGKFAPQFTLWANERPLNGGEEVMAGRLAATRSVVWTVRAVARAREIAPGWAGQNARTEELFAVREVKDPTGRRRWIEILAVSGVAGGGLDGEQA